MNAFLISECEQTWFEQRGEIAPVDDFHTLANQTFNDHSETRIKLRRPPCQIYVLQTSTNSEIYDQIGCFFIHHLGSIWTGINMTVAAGLIAQITQIDL